MCGIAGFFTADGSTPEVATLKAMTDRIAHRGPDGDGHMACPFFGFGHRRLAIIDIAGGYQPMSDERESAWITYNGEIYNYLDLRAELQSRGQQLRSKSDTEAILRLLRDDGPEAVMKLRGMFALAFWDASKRRAILARDRAGKKPLYWFTDRKGLYFASEIKALLALPNCPCDLNRDALDLYLAYEAVPGPETIFSGIHRLPPASYLTWEPGREPVVTNYWQPDWATKTTMSYGDACVRLRELIVDATRVRLISEVPLGAFLSGGVDSSAVVSAMAECAGEVRTFSIGFADQEFNETQYARMIAKKFGTTHEEFIVEPNAIDILPTLAWHYDQPFADSSALPTYYVSKMTRRHVTVALNGDGGDEWFGGYERYRALLVRAMYHGATTPALREVAARVASLLPGSNTPGSAAGKLRFFADAARGGLDEFNLRLFHHRQFESVERASLYTPAFRDTVQSHAPETYFLEAMARSAAAGCNDPVDRALRTDTLMYLPDTLLVKVDVAAMASGLEGRSPLLDTSIMEFAASLPRDWKVGARQSKRILKDAHRGIIPDEILYRRKMGFSVPLKHWFKNDLNSYVREILLDDRTTRRGYFERRVVERLIDDHQTGARNNSARLWSLLMLEHWHREVFDTRAVLR